MINLKRNEKGITLIALIITIVVLLILAVVAIGQAQETNIVGYAQNAASKYEQAQANEIGLLSTYETTLETLGAEKVVLDTGGGTKLTILPAKGDVMLEGYDGGEKITYTGTFTIESVTEDGITLWIKVPGFGETLMLVTQAKEFYIEGEKLQVISYNVSDDTLEEAIDKHTNTIGNTIGNTVGNTVENNEIAN